MIEIVVLTVNGTELPHVSCSVTASAEKAVRQAAFSVAWTAPGLPCRPDDEATVTAGGDLLLTGYVRDVNASHDANGRAYDITLVSRTCDATECSIDHPTGFLKDCDLGDIAREFDVLGIGVDVEATTAKKRVHKVNPGETLFSTLRDDARAQGVMIHDTPSGRLKLADKPEGRHAGTLKRGVNILSASGKLSGATSFSEVKSRGQASHGVDVHALRPEAAASGLARRRRPLIVLLGGEATSGRLKKRADWEARRAAGNGISADVTVAGWRDAAGAIWSPNRTIELDDDWIGIEQDMVTASVTLSQDSGGGTTATLSLKDPRALGGENPHGASDQAWAAPDPQTISYEAT